MKRATSGSVSPQPGPEHKKPRLDDPQSNSSDALARALVSSLSEEEQRGEARWHKVERRRQKKAKNIEARLLVRVYRTPRNFLVSLHYSMTHHGFCIRAKISPPERRLLEFP